jgi:poly-beta-hydroxyalkanoate depolymerase
VLYHFHDYHRALFSPAMQWAEATVRLFSSPASWLTRLPGASGVAAGSELFFRIGKRYEKPKFGISTVDAGGARVAVLEETELARPFCQAAAVHATERRRRRARAAAGSAAGAGGGAAVRAPRDAAS